MDKGAGYGLRVGSGARQAHGVAKPFLLHDALPFHPAAVDEEDAAQPGNGGSVAVWRDGPDRVTHRRPPLHSTHHHQFAIALLLTIYY